MNCVSLSCFLPIVLTLFSFCLSRGMFLHPLQGYFEMYVGFFWGGVTLIGGCYWPLVCMAEAGILNNLQCLVQSLHWRTFFQDSSSTPLQHTPRRHTELYSSPTFLPLRLISSKTCPAVALPPSLESCYPVSPTIRSS